MGSKGGCIFPVDEGFSDDGSLTKKTPGQRSWILLDASGQEMNMDVDKYVIIRRVQIHARDFRIIDPSLSYPSKILSRERAIVLNLEHIKAIITAEEVLVLNPQDGSEIPLVQELRRRLPSGNDREPIPLHEIEEAMEEDEHPFEFRALEVTLEAICSYLEARSTELENTAFPILDMLTSKLNHRNYDKLRKLKSQISSLTSRVQKVRDELHHLLEDEHLLATLHLSRKLAGESSSLYHLPKTARKTSRGSRGSLAGVLGDDTDVHVLEMLLEAYFTQIDSTVKRLGVLREYIDSTEDYLTIQLDNRRNQLYQLDLFLTAGILSLAVNALITGYFGMNFNFTWSRDGYGYTFKWVVIVAGVLSAVIFIIIVGYARHKGLFGSWTS